MAVATIIANIKAPLITVATTGVMAAVEKVGIITTTTGVTEKVASIPTIVYIMVHPTNRVALRHET